MSTMQRWTVIGIFEQQDQAKQAMDDLLQAGFSNDQLGFVYRNGVPTVTRSENGEEENVEAFAGGIAGGILGAADALLTPVLGPSVANTIPTATMPVVEQALERLHLETVDKPAHAQSATTTTDIVEDQPEEVTQKLQKPTPIEEEQAEEVTQKFVKPAAKEAPVADESPEAKEVVAADAAPATAVEEEQAARAGEATIPGGFPTTNEEQAAPTQEVGPSSEKKVREEEATGAFTGGVVGGVLGAAVALLIPVLGPAFAGGILVTAFSAALGAVTGGLLGAFVGMGIPAEQVHRYEEEFKAGRTIVTVKTDDHQQEAYDILYRHGARYANVHDRG